MQVLDAPGIGDVLSEIVRQNLSVYLYEDAKFFAERLYYENPSPEHLNMLAQCSFRQGKFKQTYLMLKTSLKLPENRYLFASACVHLKRHQEAEKALLSGLTIDHSNLKSDLVGKVPGGWAGLQLLGQICRNDNRREASIAYFKKTLEVRPTAWGALCALSEMGVKLDLQRLFHVDPSSSFSSSSSNIHPTTTTMMSSLNNAKKRNSKSKINDDSSGNNVVGATLGLASPAMHVPFASPGPNAIAYAANGDTINASHDAIASTAVDGASSSLLGAVSVARAGPTILFPATRSTTRDPQSVRVQATHGGVRGRGDQGTLMQHFQSTLDSQGASDAMMSATSDSVGAHPHRTLFTISTPGLTPIPGTTRCMGYDSDMNLTTTMNMTGEIRTLAGRGARESIAEGIEPALAAIEESHSMDRGSDHVLEDSPCDDANDDRAISSHPNRFAWGESSSVLGPDGMPPEGSRRVSFGPTARLSFSSVSGVHDSGQPVPRPATSTDPPIFTSGIVSRGGRPPQPRFDGVDLTPSPTQESTDFIQHGAGHAQSKDGSDLTPMSPAKYRKTIWRGSAGTIDPGIITRQMSGTGAFPLSSEPGGQGETVTALRNEKQHDVVVAAEKAVRHLLFVFSSAYQLLNTFKCRECIDVLRKLPARHFKSGLVHHLIGRCYHEICDYKSALLVLKEMLRLEPYRVQGTEVLSTVLWHLRRDKDLSALSQQVVEIDRLSPQAWCVLGNCFSLQREPDAAIKFFKRSLQLDPSFVYAHTLCGHELVNNEDLEKAVMSYRTAIALDDRHYNAWYGLGCIYYRQEKLDLAEYHFRRAVAVNAVSSVLKCHLSMVLYEAGLADNSEAGIYKVIEALEILTQARNADKKNPQLHFQRAHILFSFVSQLYLDATDEQQQQEDDEGDAAQQHQRASGTGRRASAATLSTDTVLGLTVIEVLQEAQHELERVRELAPKEPHVYSMLGQIYQRLGNTQAALKSYNIAIDLEPQNSAALKAALDSL